jgi:ubiquinone/menaquinone biosynthesis C-methylase UbiE
MAIDALRQTISRLNVSAAALAALGAALDARMSGVALEPAIRPYVDDVIGALGVRDALAGATPCDLQPLLGEIRALAMTNAQLLFATTRRAGWTQSEAELLLAAGDVSIAVPRALRHLAQHLPGLEQRLATPGASFLDVGVGVGALSIEMARLWPALRIVGIDRWAPALALARDRVRAAGLTERIALREQAGEELPDVDAFDLAWIPGAFVSAQATPAVIRQTFRALRPGGWLLFAMLSASDDIVATAVARLRTAMFGGFVTTPETIEMMLSRQGFVDVRPLPRTAGSAAAMVAARRPASMGANEC